MSSANPTRRLVRRARLVGLVALAIPLATVLAQAELTLEVRTDGPSYLPGELVTVTFALINGSADEVTLGATPGPENGTLGLRIARNGDPLRGYFGPGWGVKDELSVPLLLTGNDRLEVKATVLYNQPIATGHLSPAYAEQLSRLGLEEEYALGRAGSYRIQGTWTDPATGITIESPPVEIAVTEPGPLDLPVWNVLESDADLGYFIQAGGPRQVQDTERTDDIVRTLEDLASQYPGSGYTPAIRAALRRYPGN